MFIQWIRMWSLSALAVTLMSAQGGPTAQTPAQLAARQVSMLTTLLSLTSAQQASATTIFTTEETTLATSRTSLRQDESSLQTAIEANDSATIESDATAIGTLQGQGILARSQAEAAFYMLLTADQQTKYKQLLSHGLIGKGPGGNGAGRPGGGPPPGSDM